MDAHAYIAAESRRFVDIHQGLQGQADMWWAALGANDELTVCEAVNNAFSDNPAAGCAVGVSGSTLSIVMRQQDIDSLPAQTPGTTSAGRPTLKSLTKKDRVGWWLLIMASNLVATAKEAFAVAPAVTEVSIAVLTRMPDTMRLGIVAFGSWSRSAVESTPWRTPEDAYRILDIGRDVECSVRTTASGSLSTSVKPLDVARIPALRQLIEENAVDDGSDTLGELDNALAADAGVLDQDNQVDPFAPIPFHMWLTGNRHHPPPEIAPPAPATAAQLVAGQTVVLPETATYEASLRLTYRMCTPQADADLSLLLLQNGGTVGSDDDFIFYNQPSTVDRSVHIAPKTVVGANVTERAELHLSMLGARVTKVVVAISMDTDSGLSCDAIDSVVLGVGSGSQTWQFHPPADPAIKAMILAEVYRHRGPDGEPVWKLRAVGQGWAGGLADLASTHGVVID